jgi:hypothetical protein
MKTISIAIAALMISAGAAKAAPTIEFQELKGGEPMITARIHVTNNDGIDYNRVIFDCQLYDKENHPFYKEPYGVMVVDVSAHSTLSETHWLPSWGKPVAKIECKTPWLEPISNALQRFYPEPRHQRELTWK